MKKVSAGNNPHVVKMVGCVTLSSPVMLLLEYIPHGNLCDYLRKHKPDVSYLSMQYKIASPFWYRKNEMYNIHSKKFGPQTRYCITHKQNLSRRHFLH